jgi:phosphoribosylglycinamide formyltransferase-1
MKIRLAVMASGSGTNAQAIFQYFEHHPRIAMVGLLTNNPHAGALALAQRAGIPGFVIPSHPDGICSKTTLDVLQQLQVHGVVLAGFLKKIPRPVIDAFPASILNIHPALLPDFGGKGMYGKQVHCAVLQAKKTVSGITIHLVNSAYDQGPILLQVQTSIAHCMTAEDIAKQVQQLEHYWYARTIAWFFTKGQLVWRQPNPAST